MTILLHYGINKKKLKCWNLEDLLRNNISNLEKTWSNQDFSARDVLIRRMQMGAGAYRSREQFERTV